MVDDCKVGSSAFNFLMEREASYIVEKDFFDVFWVVDPDSAELDVLE